MSGAKQFIEDVKIVPLGKLYECKVCYNQAYYSDELFGYFSIALPEALKHSESMRKAEFLAGRIAAKRVLECLGILDYQVMIGALREPIWPSTLFGSISHTQSLAICMAGNRQYVSALGIDTEDWIKSGVANEIKNEITSCHERLSLAALKWPTCKILTLCFSLKESLFKALSNSGIEDPQFHDLEVIAVCQQKSTVQVRMLKSGIKKCPKGHIFTCHYAASEDYIITRFIGACD